MTSTRRDELGPDGLPLPPVGDWAETKYRFVETYAQLFARSMAGKWQTRAYIDLFAAAGWARVKGTSRIEHGTAIRALGVKPPFDRYVLCDFKKTYLDAIRSRVESKFPRADVRYVLGDCNARVPEVLSELPGEGRARGTLSFCVVDPFKLADLSFRTIKRLAMVEPGRARPMDILVLIPSYMDAHRNRNSYLKPESRVLSEFLGRPEWRSEWAQELKGGRPRDFGLFVVDRFGESMRELGYIWGGLGQAFLNRATTRRQSLYHLVLFSRHSLGQKFAREARKYATQQIDLF